MDKTLESFLHPKRKPNVKFNLTGFPNEFEMAAVPAQQGVEIQDFVESRNLNGTGILIATMAESLKVPDLRNVELQDALSAKVGKKLMHPYDVALAMFTDAEIAALVQIYSTKFRVDVDFNKDVETAKN